MQIDTSINSFNTEYFTNAISDYNKILQGNASFNITQEVSSFEQELESASKKITVKDKHDPTGLGNFVSGIGESFKNGINAVNDASIEADRMQEDIAMGGPTSIHDAMIAAEKASLSMQMAIQVRNRILSAYTDMTTMPL